MKTITPEIIQALRALKEDHALTDQMIADAVGVKRGTIGRWLRGQTPRMSSQAWFALTKFVGDTRGVQMIEPPPDGLLRADTPATGMATPLGSVSWLGRSAAHPATEGTPADGGGDGGTAARWRPAVLSAPRGVLLPTAEEISRFEAAAATGPQILGKARVRPMKGGGQSVHVIAPLDKTVKEGDLVAVEDRDGVLFGTLHVVHYIIPTTLDNRADERADGGVGDQRRDGTASRRPS